MDLLKEICILLTKVTIKNQIKILNILWTIAHKVVQTEKKLLKIELITRPVLPEQKVWPKEEVKIITIQWKCSKFHLSFSQTKQIKKTNKKLN